MTGVADNERSPSHLNVLMIDESDPTEDSSPKRFQISLGTLLLWLAITGLVVNNVVLSRRVANIDRARDAQKRELDALRPMPPGEVARQFEKHTTRGPITVSVRDVQPLACSTRDEHAVGVDVARLQSNDFRAT